MIHFHVGKKKIAFASNKIQTSVNLGRQAVIVEIYIYTCGSQVRSLATEYFMDTGGPAGNGRAATTGEAADGSSVENSWQEVQYVGMLVSDVE